MSNNSPPSAYNRSLECGLDEMKGDLTIVNNPDIARERDHLVVRCLKCILELHIGRSESLSSITSIVNETFPEYSAASVHNCLVTAFPDLQAQQSSDKEEIYYLGIKCINAQSTEYKITNWLWQRFRVDEFGCVSFRTLLDIANKELGFVKNTVIGHYVKKAFPTVYTRRSDRLRWYCGISLPEKELTPEERNKKIWLDTASKWLRENVKECSLGKEKCSLLFAALTQFVGKVSIDLCMAAVKCVFPNIPRKTIDRNAFYIGINFLHPTIREEIKYTPPKYRGVCAKKPILNEEEKAIVSWLQNVIQVNERHREKLHDLANMLRKKKMEQNLTEKTCLNYIRKAFPHVSYRKRDGVAQVTGIEIKGSFKPRDPWMDKAVMWVKEIIVPRLPSHSEKLGPILEVLKSGLQCMNHTKLCHVIRVAFPQCCVQKTLEGKLVYGISLVEDYRSIGLPMFLDKDFMGDFSCVDMNLSMRHHEEDIVGNNDLYIDVGESSQSRQNRNTSENNLAGNVRRLEEKLDKVSSSVDALSTNLKKLQEEMAASSRQKDTLIVQLQQTLVLLSQQQFQRIMKPMDTLINNEDANFMNLQALQTMQTDVNKSISLS